MNILSNSINIQNNLYKNIKNGKNFILAGGLTISSALALCSCSKPDDTIEPISKPKSDNIEIVQDSTPDKTYYFDISI